MESAVGKRLTCPMDGAEPDGRAGVVLHWIPLGAGSGTGPLLVRIGGLAFRGFQAMRRHRTGPLFHAALIVRLDSRVHAVEMAPAWGPAANGLGVIGTGPVALRGLGRSPLFRYEVRCTTGLAIADLAYAVQPPHELSTRPDDARRVLNAVARAPRPTWGRDELRTGEMWNSNALISWVLGVAGFDSAGIRPPASGCAPGWHAGVRAAARPTT